MLGLFTNLQRSFAYRLLPTQLLGWIDKVSSQLGDFVSLGNFATGGAIGTAAATVDAVGYALIAQTTAGQTLVLPNPTSSLAGQRFLVTNIGSQAFTMNGETVNTGKSQLSVWTGSQWSPVKT